METIYFICWCIFHTKITIHCYQATEDFTSICRLHEFINIIILLKIRFMYWANKFQQIWTGSKNCKSQYWRLNESCRLKISWEFISSCLSSICNSHLTNSDERLVTLGCIRISLIYILLLSPSLRPSSIFQTFCFIQFYNIIARNIHRKY